MFRLGDHAIVWREKYLQDSFKHLLGKEVIVVERYKKSNSMWDFSFTKKLMVDYDSGSYVIAGDTSWWPTVKIYGDDSNKTYQINPKSMRKIKKKIEKGSWDDWHTGEKSDFSWKPEVLK